MQTRNEKINNKDHFIPSLITDFIIKETDIRTSGIEEEQSELYYNTVSGRGKIYFQNGTQYEGTVRYGILEGKECKIVFPNRVEYNGEVTKNQLNGHGEYKFPTGARYSFNLL